MKNERTTQQFLAIDESEIRDFVSVIKEQGLDPGDFRVDETVDDPRPAAIPGLIITKATVRVTHSKTGASRRYRGGDDGTAWVVEFGQDLRSGHFR